MVLVDGPGQLDLRPGFFIGARVGDGRDRCAGFEPIAGCILVAGAGETGFGLSDGARVCISSRGEEPQLVAPNPPAERGLEGRVDRVLLFDRKRRRLRPALVSEGGAEAPLELVAARFGQHVDNAAGEVSILGRDAAGEDGRLLDRLFNVEILRLSAQVLVDDHAVDQVQAVVRHRAGDDEVVARPPGVDARSEQRHRLIAPAGRKLIDEILVDVHADRGCLDRRRHVLVCGDDDLPLHRGELEIDVDRVRHIRREREVLLVGLHPAHREGDRVLPGREERDQISPVRIRHGRARTLKTV